MSGLGDKKSQKDVTNPGNSGPSTRKFRDFATDRESFNYALKQQQGIDPSSSAALESPPNEYNPSYAPEHSTGEYGSSNQRYHSYAPEHSTGEYVLREPYVVPGATVSSIGGYVLRESSASPYAPKSPREQQSKEGALAGNTPVSTLEERSGAYQTARDLSESGLSRPPDITEQAERSFPRDTLRKHFYDLVTEWQSGRKIEETSTSKVWHRTELTKAEIKDIEKIVEENRYWLNNQLCNSIKNLAANYVKFETQVSQQGERVSEERTPDAPAPGDLKGKGRARTDSSGSGNPEEHAMKRARTDQLDKSKAFIDSISSSDLASVVLSLGKPSEAVKEIRVSVAQIRLAQEVSHKGRIAQAVATKYEKTWGVPYKDFDPVESATNLIGALEKFNPRRNSFLYKFFQDLKEKHQAFLQNLKSGEQEEKATDAEPTRQHHAKTDQSDSVICRMNDGRTVTIDWKKLNTDAIDGLKASVALDRNSAIRSGRDELVIYYEKVTRALNTLIREKGTNPYPRGNEPIWHQGTEPPQDPKEALKQALTLLDSGHDGQTDKAREKYQTLANMILENSKA